MISRILFFLLGVSFYLSGFAEGHGVPVHDAISDAAIQKSTNLQTMLSDFSEELKQLPRLNANEYRMYQETASTTNLRNEMNGVEFNATSPDVLLRFGSVMEDYGDRVLHHFYEPEREDSGQGLHNPVGSFSDAQSWAFNRSNDNMYSWEAAYDDFLNGLTLSSREERKENLASMFYTLGHVLHLVQDMSQPSHTRNDPHGGHGLGGFSQLELWEQVPQNFETILRSVAHSDSARWFPSSRAYLRELACLSSTNYFSDDTVNPAYTPLFATGRAPCRYPPLWAITDETEKNVEQEADLKDFLYLYNSGGALPGPGVSSSSFLPSRDWFMASLSILDDPFLFQLIFGHFEEARSYAVFSNPAVITTNAQTLLPTAVEYSAGLLDFFFRARLHLTIKNVERRDKAPDLITYELKNISHTIGGDPHPFTLMDIGAVRFYEQKTDGVRVRGSVLDRTSLNGKSLAPGESVVFYASYDDESENASPNYDAVVVYDGNIGNERGVGGARLSFEDPCNVQICATASLVTSSDSFSPNYTTDTKRISVGDESCPQNSLLLPHVGETLVQPGDLNFAQASRSGEFAAYAVGQTTINRSLLKDGMGIAQCSLDLQSDMGVSAQASSSGAFHAIASANVDFFGTVILFPGQRAVLKIQDTSEKQAIGNFGKCKYEIKGAFCKNEFCGSSSDEEGFKEQEGDILKSVGPDPGKIELSAADAWVCDSCYRAANFKIRIGVYADYIVGGFVAPDFKVERRDPPTADCVASASSRIKVYAEDE